MIYAFDLDNTLCHTNGMDYQNSEPNPKAVAKLNKLYEDGHVIKIFTARGTVSGLSFRELTEGQLKAWGVKYNELILGKPAYDVWVDDLAINAKDWLND